MKAVDFLNTFGVPLAKEILEDAPEWAKNFNFKHFEKRIAQNKRINSWGEQSFRELKNSHIPTNDLVSLSDLKQLVSKVTK